MTIRQQLRQQLRTARKLLTITQRETASEQLSLHFCQHPLFQQAQHIACYLSNDGEIDPIVIMQKIWQLGKICYLPTLDPRQTKQIYFVRYQPGDPLNPNRYKILEPIPDPVKTHLPNELDLILVPLVGFDDQGNRLGMGGGFYDRTFAFLKPPCKIKKPRLIGLAYELQKVDHLPVAAWDIPMHAVVTERTIHTF